LRCAEIQGPRGAKITSKEKKKGHYPLNEGTLLKAAWTNEAGVGAISRVCYAKEKKKGVVGVGGTKKVTQNGTDAPPPPERGVNNFKKKKLWRGIKGRQTAFKLNQGE